MTVERLIVGGSPDPWARLGFRVVDRSIPLFGTGIRIDPAHPAGLRSWELSGVDADVDDVDGLATAVVAPSAPVLVEHPNGAIGLDHVVVVTDALGRTSAAVTAVTGAPCKRVREVGELRQGFHRVGRLVVELVERAGLVEGPATFWGLVVDVEDLDAAVAGLGPDLVGESRPAVQPGRSIATVREAAGLGVPVALMTP